MIRLTLAEQLLKELGITDPSEIDLDAIAFHVGASVKYRELDGCDARILGVGDRAIISINAQQGRRRQRFSLGHELGHWKYHRGRTLLCSTEEIGAIGSSGSPLEHVANEYAADLIMPWFLFRPILKNCSKVDTAAIDKFADLFEVSRSATAIRTVQSNEFPLMLVCHNKNGRRWFKRSRCLPERWFPQQALDPDSYAFDLVFSDASERSIPSVIPADSWFDRTEARKYELQEQSFRTGNQDVLTLLTITDEGMLEE